MKNYEKPIVLLNNELSEGVYTASGDFKANGVIERFYGEPSKYTVSIKNNSGESVETVSAFLYEYGTVTGVFSVSSGLSCTRTGDGRVLLSYTGSNKIPTGEFTQDLYFYVTGDGGLKDQT